MSHRRLVSVLSVGLLTAAALVWTSMAGGFLWTDYEIANAGPFHALRTGDLSTFFSSAPIEGPSLLLRAPFALLPNLWGGGPTATFYLVAVPGVLATVVLGRFLFAERERLFGAQRWGWLILALAAFNPTAYRALEMGHPEELFGAVLAIFAVIAGLKDRPWLAAVLLGVAIGNKAWAVVAIGPVLLAVPRYRVRVLCVAGVIALAIVAPFVLSEGGRAGIAKAGTTDAVFQPQQVFWFLGHHTDVLPKGFFGMEKAGYRVGPQWIVHIGHPLIVLMSAPLTLLWMWRRRGERSFDLLLLLALILLVRCMLDVADNVYYHLPFFLALLTWEALGERRPPVFSLLATVFFALSQHFNGTLSADGQSIVYLAAAVPTLAALGFATYAVRLPVRRRTQVAAPA